MSDLYSYYNQELIYYKKILEISKLLEEAVKDKNSKKAEEYLGARHDILKKILVLEERISRLVKNSQNPGNITTQRLAGVIDAIRMTNAEIRGIYKNVDLTLKAEKQEVYNQLMKISHGHKALKGYAPKRIRIPRYVSMNG